MERNEIFVIYGEALHDMTLALLERADLAGQIRSKSVSSRNSTSIEGADQPLIGIKPNLVGTIAPEKGATTHPEIIAAIIEYLKTHGFHNLLILEGSWVGDNTKRAFRALGFEKIRDTYHVPLLDTKQDSFIQKSYNGIHMEISKTALSLDFLINVPVLKGHCQTKMTGALKNLKGIISDREKRHFHTLGLHEPIACLNKLICADFVVVDGICGDLDFEEGGNPVSMNRIACGLDSVLVDSYIAATMGYDPDDIRYITIADNIGVGSKHLETAHITELNQDTTKVKPSVSHRVQKLSKYTCEKDACSACYANLIQALARLEDAGKLSNYQKNSFAIGQGWKGKTDDNCIGIGNCAGNFKKHVTGCPVQAGDVIKELTTS